jgi:hypothetical protein
LGVFYLDTTLKVAQNLKKPIKNNCSRVFIRSFQHLKYPF